MSLFRRRCVDQVMARLSVSERFACGVPGRHRSAPCEKPGDGTEEEALTADIEGHHRGMAALLQQGTPALAARRYEPPEPEAITWPCAAARIDTAICPDHQNQALQADHASGPKPDHLMGQASQGRDLPVKVPEITWLHRGNCVEGRSVFRQRNRCMPPPGRRQPGSPTIPQEQLPMLFHLYAGLQPVRSA